MTTVDPSTLSLGDRINFLQYVMTASGASQAEIDAEIAKTLDEASPAEREAFLKWTGQTSTTSSGEGAVSPPAAQEPPELEPEPTTAAPTAPVISEKAAQDIVRGVLEPLGMGSLFDWAWNKIYKGEANGDLAVAKSLVELKLPQQADFKARFPAFDALVQKGFAGGTLETVARIIEYERQAAAVFNAAGIPQSFYDTPAELQDFLANDISLAELQSRVQLASTQAQQTLEVQQEFTRLFGISSGQMTAFFLDPDKALPLLQAQVAQSRIAGAAVQSGFGQLVAEEAQRLQQLGLSDEAAREGFTQLATSRGLFDPLVSEEGIGRDVQLGATFEGDAADIETVRRQQQRRTAAFEGSGGHQVGQGGVTSLSQ